MFQALRARATSISAATELRAGTRSEHESVDGLFGRLDLSRMADYRLFLGATAAAYVPVERALDAAGIGEIVGDWRERVRSHLLDQDLAEARACPIEPLTAPCFGDVPAMLGAVYVLEGSRLGGALLKRSLPTGTPARFLNAPAEPGSWRRLLGLIDAHLSRPVEVVRACDSARSVFRLFETAGRRVIGTPSLA